LRLAAVASIATIVAGMAEAAAPTIDGTYTGPMSVPS
jgi:hypothetical protein